MRRNGCIGILGFVMLVLLSRPSAAQDSGTGVDLHLGNALDPSGVSHLGCDPDGMSWLTAERRRTPTGTLYLCPPARDVRPIGSGQWHFGGSFGIGALGTSGDDRNTNWLRYTNWSDSAIGRVDLQFVRPDDGRYVDVRGSYVNGDNQFYKVIYGRAGRFKVEGFLRSQPNVTAGQSRSIWDGKGTASLTLKAGLAPAASTPAQVAEVSAASPEEVLSVVRDKQGGNFNYYLGRQTTMYANAAHESRSGTRPFGGPFFFAFIGPGFGGVYETPRPIDDRSVSINSGLRHTGRVWNFEGGYNGSFFRSGIDAFQYEVPFPIASVVPGATSVPLRTGGFAYEPDNDYHAFRGRATRKFGVRNQLSVDAAYSTSRQNDDLAVPMDCSGQFGLRVPGFLYECANWNTASALSRRTADLAINSALVNGRVVLRPTRAVTMHGNVRVHSQSYKGDYFALNPITGQYGYVAENGAQGSTVPGEMGVWDAVSSPGVVTRVRNLPLDKDAVEASGSADWRVDVKNTLGATFMFTRTNRTNREVEHQTDRLLKFIWTSRAVDDMTLRTSYSYLDRNGRDYNYDPYEFTYSTDLPGFLDPGDLAPHTVELLRKYDVGGRQQHKLMAVVTFMLPQAMTLAGTVRGDWNDYDAELGREAYDTSGFSAQWDWQPTERMTANLFFGYDRANVAVANLNELASFGSDPSMDGDTYVEANRWWVDDAQRNYYAGAGFMRQIRNTQLDVYWNYTDSRGLTSYRFNSPGALAYAAFAAESGNAFPPMLHRINTLNLSWSTPLRDRLGLKVFGVIENGRLSDWHYAGFDTKGLVINNRVYLDAGPRDYSANLVGVMLTVKL